MTATTDQVTEKEKLLASLKKLLDHCNCGMWAGAAKRAAVVRDLEEAEALIAELDAD